MYLSFCLIYQNSLYLFNLKLVNVSYIRLGLTYLNRITLPGETVPLQGQLAVLSRENDREMMELFACLDNRKNHVKSCT